MSPLFKLLHFQDRFHDARGNWIDLPGLIFVPISLASFVSHKLCRVRWELPWIGFRAIHCLDKLIQPNWQILEFGSGMSTLWLAQRAGRVLSLESYPEWYEIVKNKLIRRGLTHVEYLLDTTPKYTTPSAAQDATFDLVIVDGAYRGKCAETAVSKVKPGGYVYLDNTDMASQDEQIAHAERVLLEAAAARRGWHRYFTDFTPNYLMVTQGLLVRL